jgi:Xaa-Pro dipeptidase
VEPGCYFIDALLTQARGDPISSKFFNWQGVENYKSFGGVRIESDVVCLGYLVFVFCTKARA